MLTNRIGLVWARLGGLALGLGFLLLGLALERYFRKISLRAIGGGVLGLLVGLVLARLLIVLFSPFLFDPAYWNLTLFILSILLSYWGLVLGGKKSDEWSRGLESPSGVSTLMEKPWLYLLDTSVIIDGRIADLSETGLLPGTFVIPQFILQELHHIADSGDPLKKTRGRRGLDIIEKLQKHPELNVRIVDRDPPKDNVDAKLVDLALELGGLIITNDFNLNKVAELQGIKVLNLNKLANALKPAVLPGEVLNVQIIREGKTPGQGIAYLDDGTMVVVENARRHIGQVIDVTVTSVLQTGTGRMIFTEVRG
ncbi:MAG: TRAM domain-containing protein [Deltaproteobacteria bacterium]|nr:TRAM domain-containing protein [Deltaproteobacteria bacterium]